MSIPRSLQEGTPSTVQERATAPSNGDRHRPCARTRCLTKERRHKRTRWVPAFERDAETKEEVSLTEERRIDSRIQLQPAQHLGSLKHVSHDPPHSLLSMWPGPHPRIQSPCPSPVSGSRRVPPACAIAGPRSHPRLHVRRPAPSAFGRCSSDGSAGIC